MVLTPKRESEAYWWPRPSHWRPSLTFMQAQPLPEFVWKGTCLSQATIFFSLSISMPLSFHFLCLILTQPDHQMGDTFSIRQDHASNMAKHQVKITCETILGSNPVRSWGLQKESLFNFSLRFAQLGDSTSLQCLSTRLVWDNLINSWLLEMWTFGSTHLSFHACLFYPKSKGCLQMGGSKPWFCLGSTPTMGSKLSVPKKEHRLATIPRTRLPEVSPGSPAFS